MVEKQKDLSPLYDNTELEQERPDTQPADHSNASSYNETNGLLEQRRLSTTDFTEKWCILLFKRF